MTPLHRVRRALGATVAAVMAVAVAACSGTAASPSASPTDAPTDGAPETVTVASYQGEVEVPFQPERVVVLDHAILDTLDTFGLGDRVVGIPHHVVPSFLSSYQESAANVGTLFEPDLEAINALEPDLIILGGRSGPLLPDVQDIAPAIDLTFEWEADLFIDTFKTNTTSIGQIFGIEDQVAGQLAQFDAEAGAIAGLVGESDATGLVLLTSAGEVSAYGPGSRFDIVYNFVGVKPAAEQVAIDDHGDAVSFEFIAQVNPDYIFVLDRDAAIGVEGEAAQAILDNELVNGTSAGQNGKIIYVNTEQWYLSFGGVTSVLGIIREVGGSYR